MGSTPAAGLVVICIALSGCGKAPAPVPRTTKRQPAPVPKTPPRKTVPSWNDVAVVDKKLPALVLPTPGERVLARRNLPTDLHYHEAVVITSGASFVSLRYENGDTASVPPRALVLKRGIRAGDLVYFAGRPLVFARARGASVAVVHEIGDAKLETEVDRIRLRVVLRTDRNTYRRVDADSHKVGNRVLAKWDARAWWVGTVIRLQGEAIKIRYDDKSTKWMPADHAIRLSRLVPGLRVMGINKRDGQSVPAILVAISKTTARLRFFDGNVQTLPLARLAAYVDQLGLNYGDPCKRTGADNRVHANTLRGWLTKQIHFYSVAPHPAINTTPAHLELGFALWLPSNRKARKNWKRLLELLAEQVRRFLKLELAGVKVEVRVYKDPVVSKHDLQWFKANLREADSWHVWQPTGESVRKVFPGGAKAGRHRIVVVVPDAPGISADSSGVERQMGFVRAKGAFFDKLTESGLYSVSKGSTPKTSFHQWREDYLATTLAHEALHTIGLPHTDGDPWSVMNIGPWYPITQQNVHISQLHKLVLHSPFASLALSQGFAHYLMERLSGYLDVIAQRHRLDTSLSLYYAGGEGHFRLTQTLTAFSRGGRLYRGARKYTGERAIVRAYLASLIQFIADSFGTQALRKLFGETDIGAEVALSNATGVTGANLQIRWHLWLGAKLKSRRQSR